MESSVIIYASNEPHLNNEPKALESEQLTLFLPKELNKNFAIELRPRLYQQLIVDCSELKKIRAEGFDLLIRFFRSQDERIHYVFKSMPEELIKAFNQTPESLPRHYIVSSFAFPMECEDCEHIEYEWLVRGRHYLEAVGDQPAILTMLPQQLNCPKCRGMMESAEDKISYLRFLNTQGDGNEAE